VGEQFLTHAVKVLDALNTAGQALNRKDDHTSEIVRVGACQRRRWAFCLPLLASFTSSKSTPRFRSRP
jgi:DNA-binding transcriptional LysR family regulator